MAIILHDGSNRFKKRLSSGLSAGDIHPIHKGIYIEAQPGAVSTEVRKHWNALTAAIVPDGVLTDRTAMEGVPTQDVDNDLWYVFVSAPRTRNVFRLPGLIINLREGAGPQEGDPLYMNLPIAGLARRLLDNLTPSRARNGPARTMGVEGVEIAIERQVAVNGLFTLPALLKEAQNIAPEIGRETELRALSGIIDAFVSNRPAGLRSAQAASRAQGLPEDDRFLAIFAATLRAFDEHRVPDVVDAETTWEMMRESCFMEAYFSNYIEGTQFLMEEARDIVLENRPTARVKDGHDIQSTFELLMSQPRAPVLDLGFDGFLEEIRRQHAVLMRGRPEVGPGMFKDRPNRAGRHRFVEPEAVFGTLKRGWAMLKTVKSPFAGAMGLHYLIAGVHPFNDGNGRMSRLMMTQEMRAHGLSRIVVPTVSRQSYIAGLRNISDRADVFTFVRSMETFQRITAACVSGDPAESHRLWASTYAFCDDEKRANLAFPSLTRDLREDGGVLAPSDYWETDNGLGFPI